MVFNCKITVLWQLITGVVITSIILVLQNDFQIFVTGRDDAAS